MRFEHIPHFLLHLLDFLGVALHTAMKDHKPDFLNNPTCRLINPSKSEIGIISKHILDGINTKILQATKVNLWKSTSNAIEWFKSIPEKEKQAFITFDVCDFYPSITKGFLIKALDYASKFTSITVEDRQIIIYAKKSPLPPKFPVDKKSHQHV